MNRKEYAHHECSKIRQVASPPKFICQHVELPLGMLHAFLRASSLLSHPRQLLSLLQCPPNPPPRIKTCMKTVRTCPFFGLPEPFLERASYRATERLADTGQPSGLTSYGSPLMKSPPLPPLHPRTALAYQIMHIYLVTEGQRPEPYLPTCRWPLDNMLPESASNTPAPAL